MNKNYACNLPMNKILFYWDMSKEFGYGKKENWPLSKDGNYDHFLILHNKSINAVRDEEYAKEVYSPQFISEKQLLELIVSGVIPEEPSITIEELEIGDRFKFANNSDCELMKVDYVDLKEVEKHFYMYTNTYLKNKVFRANKGVKVVKIS